MRRGITKRQVERLVVGYPSHGFVIDYEELVDMELPVRPAEGIEHDILQRLGLFLVKPPIGCPDEIAYVPADGDERAESDDGEDDDGPEMHAAADEEAADEEPGGDEVDEEAAAEPSADPGGGSRRGAGSTRRRGRDAAAAEAGS